MTFKIFNRTTKKDKQQEIFDSAFEKLKYEKCKLENRTGSKTNNFGEFSDGKQRFSKSSSNTG